MTPEEIAIEEAALEFAKANRTSLARTIADTNIFAAEASPLTVFMAGSPGAGKNRDFQGDGRNLGRRDSRCACAESFTH